MKYIGPVMFGAASPQKPYCCNVCWCPECRNITPVSCVDVYNPKNITPTMVLATKDIKYIAPAMI